MYISVARHREVLFSIIGRQFGDLVVYKVIRKL
jgi:hypothetical protein